MLTTPKSASALKYRANRAPEPQPIVYWNVCQGIQPFVIESPRLFLAAQALVVLVIVPVMLVVLQIL